MSETTDTLIQSSWDHAKDLGDDGFAVFKRLAEAHAAMTEASVALRLANPADPRLPILRGNVNVKRVLWREALEIEAKDFGIEVVNAALSILLELVA